MSQAPLVQAGLALSLVAQGLFAQGLIADLEPGRDASPSSMTSSGASIAGLAWFPANNREVGIEPYVSDGTPAGTRLLADLNPGAAPSQPRHFVPFGNGAAFTTAYPGALWVSDGTRAGTRQVGLMAGLEAPAAVGSQLFFWGFSAATGGELFVSDGTGAGTRLVVELVPGIQSAELTQFRASGAKLYFRFQSGLWCSDGTSAGTIQLGSSSMLGSVNEICAVNGVVYVATERFGVGELWRSDGTIAGTSLVHAGFTVWPYRLAALGNELLFVASDGTTANGELWASDGTTAGTRLVYDFQNTAHVPVSIYSPFTVIGNVAYFSAEEAATGAELWRSDGTRAGTWLVSDIWNSTWSSYPQEISRFGNQLVFSADHWAHGRELWISDGTRAGTRIVVDLVPGQAASGSPTYLMPLANHVVFFANDGAHGFEPLASDGTAAGTGLLADLLYTPLDSSPSEFARFGERTVFSAQTVATGREAWLSDGTAAGTVMLADLVPGAAGANPHGFVEWQGRLWFAANDAAGDELWNSDGTAAGSSRFLDLNPGAGSSLPQSLTPHGQRLFFVALDSRGHRELHVSDGTPAGTTMLDFDPTTSADPQSLTPYGDLLAFVARDASTGRELWLTDGTLAGTRRVTDVAPGPVDSGCFGLRVCNGLLWFSATTTPFTYLPLADLDPYVSDGSVAGTRRVFDFPTRSVSVFTSTFVPFAGRTWFPLASGFSYQLWSSDGSGAGTRLEFDPGIGYIPGNLALCVAGRRLFFAIADLIWSSDGSPAGTTNFAFTGAGVREVMPLGSSSRIVFTAERPVLGREIWTSDGTLAGTVMQPELLPGVSSAAPHYLDRAGDTVWFSFEHPLLGRELAAMHLSDAGGALVERFGQGCGGSAGVPEIGALGQPLLGDPGFAVTLDRAVPNSGAWFLIGGFLFAGGDVLGCSFKLVPPAIAVGVGTDAMGRATLPLGIPNQPSLLGVELYAHWLQIDPNGGFLGSLALSDMLEVLIGR